MWRGDTHGEWSKDCTEAHLHHFGAHLCIIASWPTLRLGTVICTSKLEIIVNGNWCTLMLRYRIWICLWDLSTYAPDRIGLPISRKGKLEKSYGRTCLLVQFITKTGIFISAFFSLIFHHLLSSPWSIKKKKMDFGAPFIDRHGFVECIKATLNNRHGWSSYLDLFSQWKVLPLTSVRCGKHIKIHSSAWNRNTVNRKIA